MHEFELIERFFRRQGGQHVALGIGDDGAVLDLPDGCQLVAVVDTLVTGVHFPGDMAAADIGYRAVAVNLSDIAAMGGVPAWMTLALTLPVADAGWLEEFSAGLFAAAAAHDVALVGGDTTSGQELVVSVQVLGYVDAGNWLARSGCQDGDGIYVSGHPGDAAAGLELVKQGEGKHYLSQRFLRPVARIGLGQAAAGLASAAIDISDGLCADLEHLLAASSCGATIEQERLPLSAALVERVGPDAAARLALAGGDDYELLLAVGADNEAAFLQAAAATGVAVTRIGRAEKQRGLRVTAAGQLLELDATGYRHFDTRENEAE